MAGSNSVFNAPLELKSCRLPMPPSSGSRIHPSRCFCPLPAAPNANNLAGEFRSTCSGRKSDSISQRTSKRSCATLIEFGVQSIPKVIGTQSGKTLGAAGCWRNKSHDWVGPRGELMLLAAGVTSDTKPHRGL